MPKLKNYRKGKRVNVYLLEKQLQTHSQIANFSAFVQIAVDIAPDIMAWAILNNVDPKKFNTGRKVEDFIDEFNEKFPQDELTQKRLGNEPRTKPKHSNSRKESNPALR